jgi:hypothetical protein
MTSYGDSDIWTVDPVHSSVEFRVKYMMISTVRGGRGVELDIGGAPLRAAQILVSRSTFVSMLAASVRTSTCPKRCSGSSRLIESKRPQTLPTTRS